MSVVAALTVDPVPLTEMKAVKVNINNASPTAITTQAAFGAGAWKLYMIQVFPTNTAAVYWSSDATLNSTKGAHLDGPVIVAWDHIQTPLYGYADAASQAVIVTAFR